MNHKLPLLIPFLLFAICAKAQPHAEFLLSAPDGCVDDEISVINLSFGGVVAYDWDFGDGGTSSAISPTYIYGDTGTFTITLTVTDGDGLTDTWTETYIVHPPVANFILVPDEGCSTPHTVFFTDNSTLPDTWFWDFGDGSTSTLQNPIHNYTAAGTFDVVLTVTDTVYGCSDTYTDSVKVGVPTAEVDSEFGYFGCGPLTVDFENSSSNDGAGILTEYLWDLGDGETSTEFEPTHIYDTPGIYTVTLTVTNSLGCTDTEVRPTLVQVIGPDVNFGWDTTFAECPDLEVNFTDSTIFGAPIISWDWDFGDGGTSGLQNPTYVYTDYGVYSVSLTVTDIDGCTRTLTMDDLILIEDVVLPTFLDCPEEITETLSGGCDFTLPDYAVSFVPIDNCTDPLTVSQTPASGTVISSSEVVTLETTDASGNIGTCSFTVQLIDEIAPTIECPDDQNISFDTDCAFTLPDYTSLATASDNCLDPIISQAPLPGTILFSTETITLTATDTAGNTASCSFDVIPVDDAAPSIDCPSDITVNTDLGLCGALVTYTEPVGVDNCISTTTLTAGLASDEFFPVGITLVTFEVTDGADLSASCSFDVTVIDNEDPTILCPEDITANTSPESCGTEVTYTPPVTDDNCGVEPFSLTSGIPSGGFFPIGVTENTFTVADVNGNTNVCSFEVTVIDNVLPEITCPDNVSSCEATILFDEPTVTDNCEGAFYALLSGISSGGSFPIGETVNTYEVTDASGNSVTCEMSITRFEQPIVDAGEDVTIDAGKEVMLEGTSDLTGTFSWSPEDGLDDPTLMNPVAELNTTVTYTLTVTTPEGCSGTDEVTVTVNQVIEVNNFVSPNGDGKNDAWEVKGNHLLDDCQVTIYDSWGNVILEQTGYQNDWEGTRNGTVLPAGVYYYVIQCQGGEARTGSITLIR